MAFDEPDCLVHAITALNSIGALQILPTLDNAATVKHASRLAPSHRQVRIHPLEVGLIIGRWNCPRSGCKSRRTLTPTLSPKGRGGPFSPGRRLG